MRRIGLIAALAACAVLIAAPATGAGPRDPVGEKFSLVLPCLQGLDPVPPEPDTDFYVRHGWGLTPALEDDLGQFTFDLWVDGVELKGMLIVNAGSGAVSRAWLYNFPGGLNGEHTFRTVWTAAPGSEHHDLDCTFVVNFGS